MGFLYCCRRSTPFSLLLHVCNLRSPSAWTRWSRRKRIYFLFQETMMSFTKRFFFFFSAVDMFFSSIVLHAYSFCFKAQISSTSFPWRKLSTSVVCSSPKMPKIEAHPLHSVMIIFYLTNSFFPVERWLGCKYLLLSGNARRRKSEKANYLPHLLGECHISQKNDRMQEETHSRDSI